jgi:hypothetical protein
MAQQKRPIEEQLASLLVVRVTVKLSSQAE